MAFVCKMTDTSGVTGPIASGIYGTCSTAADTAAKVVTCADLDKLIVGCVIYVRFDYGNTKADATLNVNSLGAKDIICGTSGTATPPSTLVKTANNNTASWFSGEVVGFMYDVISSTGYWRIVSQTHARFTTTSVGSASAGTAISASLVTAGDPFTASKVTLGDPLKASKVTLGTAIPADDITDWSAGSLPALKWTSDTASKVTLGTALSASKVTKSNVSVPNITSNESVTIPNVTGNTNVTFYGVDTINTVVTAATISEGVLTFSTGASITKTAQKTASKVTLGTALTATNTVLGTANTAHAVTISDVSIPNVTGNTSVNVSYLGTSSETTPSWSAGSLPSLSYTAKSIPNVTGNTEVTIPNVTAATDVSVPNLTITPKSIPNISVSSKTVLTTR